MSSKPVEKVMSEPDKLLLEWYPAPSDGLTHLASCAGYSMRCDKTHEEEFCWGIYECAGEYLITDSDEFFSDRQSAQIDAENALCKLLANDIKPLMPKLMLSLLKE